ncbi:hypothetical protein C2845_PM06G01770 [Panicum miliaceum]|uniref:Uncharacterized protein n=1 Tax=Panicum miliaceum TaxID=4540 RepID=A0A3L6RAI4_PANMI|nr:hypothetical protein C2845_PM06G01770 [Panicum miliaceum]
MTMPWGVAVCIVDMVWAVLAGWVSTCLVVANEVARAMRNGEIGPFVVGDNASEFLCGFLWFSVR